MEKLALVGLGGAFGSMARYLTGVAAGRLVRLSAPWLGTFTVNLVGGCLMGLLVGYLAHRGGVGQERWRLLLAVGVLGGYTTFSSFSLDAVLMIERREYVPAALYMIASVALSICALIFGLRAARLMFT